MTAVPVVIVGAGPTGITAATLLAQYGVDSLVLDRWANVYPQPRAVHLDDEIYRVVARLGIADEFAAISRPARGLRLLDPTMGVLAATDADLDQWDGVHQVCDPVRAGTYMSDWVVPLPLGVPAPAR